MIQVEKEHREIRTRLLTAMWSRPFDAGWVKVLGYGIGVVDHRKTRPLFSERHNGTHGIKKRLYLHIGPWCVKFLRPASRRSDDA